jgi:hypothetical protein
MLNYAPTGSVNQAQNLHEEIFYNYLILYIFLIKKQKINIHRSRSWRDLTKTKIGPGLDFRAPDLAP